MESGKGGKAMEPIEVYMAKRLRAARLARGMSQVIAGTVLGVTFQQMQKYEKGTNRISLGKVLKLCETYHTTLAKLLEGGPGIDGTKVDTATDVVTTMLALPYAVDVARAFIAMDADSGNRQVLRSVARALAGTS